MGSLARSRLVRDVLLVFLGAVSMHFVTTLFHPFDELSPTWTIQTYDRGEIIIDPPPYDEDVFDNKHYGFNNPVFESGNELSLPPPAAVAPVDVLTTIPETEMIHHAPGWTVFKNLYMSNGTLYVVSDKPRSEFPELVYILSVAIPALDSPENIQARLPTDQQMDFISTRDAQRRWGPVRSNEKNRIWSIAGNTVRVFLTEVSPRIFFPFSGRSFRLSCLIVVSSHSPFVSLFSGGPSLNTDADGVLSRCAFT